MREWLCLVASSDCALLLLAVRHAAVMKLIRSPSNPTVKRLMLLRKKEHREELQQMVVEGQRAISGFLENGWEMDLGILRQDLQVPDQWPHEEGRVELAHHSVINKLSTHHSPSGYYAVFRIPRPAELDLDAGGLIFFDIKDPGNCGTLIRSAAAFGWRQVVCIGGVDPWNTKVVQASVGAVAAIPIHCFKEDTPLASFAQGAPLAGLVLAGGTHPQKMDRKNRWLVIGNEAHGIPRNELEACSERISIPMASKVESLNAGVAGSIAASILGLQD